MKKRTLNQTWTLCLRMWRWIAKVWQTEGYEGKNVHALKRMWLNKHGFEHQWGDCFFCEHREQADGFCSRACPGALVNPNFSCTDPDYDYEHKPVEFYKELLRLNRIRKAK